MQRLLLKCILRCKMIMKISSHSALYWIPRKADCITNLLRVWELFLNNVDLHFTNIFLQNPPNKANTNDLI